MVEKENCVIWIQTVSMNTQKTDDFYQDTAEDVETGFDNSNYEIHIPLPK